MYGKPCRLPKGGILLRPHWQYHIKRTGQRRARNCCDGSARAAPLLHQLASTYSSCVEQPVQRLFVALSALLDHKIYGGDAADAFAHSPGPDVPTYVSIDDAYAEWYEERQKTSLDRSLVLPVKRALQGHPESGKLFQRHIDKIITSPELNFRATVLDRSLYRTEYEGETVLLLRQLDDFALSCNSETVANEIVGIIVKKLQLPNEDNPPFEVFGLVKDFDGVLLEQRHGYIKIHYSCYIDRLLRTHKWDTDTF